MALTLESLKKSVKSYQDANAGGNKEWPNTVFLPDGTHKVRFITDPKDEIFIEYWSYGYFANGIRDPSNDTGVPEGFVNELKKLYEDGFKPLNKWSYGAKNPHLVYVYLYETTAPNENWQPNNLYVAVTNNKFGESFANFLSALATDAPEEILKTLDPSRPGVVLTLETKSGRDGKCSIGAAFPTKIAEPIDMTGRPYLPLDECYIKPGFKQEKYDNLVKRYKDDLAKFQIERKAYEAANPPKDVTPTEPSPMIPAAQPDKVATPEPASAPESVAQPSTIPVDTPPFTPDTVTAPVTQPAATGSVWDKFKK